MARGYFFGSIRRGLKGVAKKLAQLAGGNVKGAILNFAKQILGAVIPGSDGKKPK
jgi:hypothetical protein